MDNFQIQPQMQQHMPPRSFGPAEQPYLPPQNHRKRNLILLCSVLAAVVVIACVCWFSYTRSSGYRIRRGFMRLAKENTALKNPMEEKLGMGELCRMLYTEGAQADAKLNVTYDSFLVGEVTFGVDTDYAKDRKKRKMSLSSSLSLMRYELGHLDVYADQDHVCFSVPELFLNDLYVENENVLAQYNHSMWAQDWLFGEAQGDDFSIDLFSSPWYVTDEEGAGKAILKRYAGELDSCRRHMKMEKAGEGIYRISFEGLYVNNLIRQVLNDWLHDSRNSSMPYKEDVLGLVSYFDVAAGPEEISFLLEIDEADRIESIRLEHPISLGRGAVRIDGDVYFLGGENSLEKIQGRVFLDNKNNETIREQEIVWQVVRSLDQGEYQMESEAKYSFLRDEMKQTIKLEGDFSYDGPKNSFKAKACAELSDIELAWEASGDFSHIKKGEGFDLELDELRCLTEGEETVLVRGEISLAPLSRQVKQIAKPETAFFSMDEDSWFAIVEKLDKEYGPLLEEAMDYLW